MYSYKKISVICASLLLLILIFSGCQNSNSTNSVTPTVTPAERGTPQTSAETPTTPTTGTFNYSPAFISFESLETMGNAMKGYELNDVVKNDPRFTEEEKAAIEHIQETKGHNNFYFDVPDIKDKAFTLSKEVRLIYSSDIEKGKGVQSWCGCGVGFTITDGTYNYDFDIYGVLVYDQNPEYTSTIQGTTVSDTEEALVLLLGSNNTARVYDVYLDKRCVHIRLVSNAPTEQVLSLVNAVQLDTYEYDKIV